MSGNRGAHLAILLTLVFGYNVASSQLLDFYENEIIVKPDETIECKSQLECVSCNEGRMCMWLNGKLVQYATITCDTKMDTPYCNNGTCSKIPQPECVKGGESSQFVCPETDGVYPDPSSCTIYHICAKRVVTTNVCPRNNVYDHESGGCKYVRLITNANCVTISCIRKEGQSFVYPRDDRIYGKCLLGKPYILGRCKNYERYDLAQNKCVRHCRATGVQPPYDPKECRKYVYCAEVSPRKYEPVEMACACNEGYDEKANRCVQNADCLKDIINPCKTEEKNSEGGGNGNTGEQPENTGNDGTNTDQVSPLIINNSGNNNNNNDVANGDDNVRGNLVNGNNNGDNSDSGNVANRTSSSSSQIINNSGNNNNENNVSNGDDEVNGNLVNGNNNGNNNNSGNVANGDPVPSPLIINNSGNNNGNNNITNGNDNVNGNLVNGNNNGDNRESGNVQRRSVPTIDNYIINNSGNNNNKNDVSNGDDSVDGNIVNGNDNGDNINSGNVKTEDSDIPSSPPIINDSVENDNGNNDEVSNGADGNATDVDGNDNNNDNSDNVDTSQPIENPRNPRNRKIYNFLHIFFDWVIRITIGLPPVN